jgi:hypothetical protein
LKINFRQVSSRSSSVEKSNPYSNKDFLFLICSLLLFYPCGFFMCIFSLLLELKWAKLTLVKQKISFAVPTPSTFSSLFG